MKLRSTASIIRGLRDQLPDTRVGEADRLALEELRRVEVLVENVGDTPFEGEAARFDGREYPLRPGQKRLIPLDAVYHFLGDWSSAGTRRRVEHERLYLRYAGFRAVHRHDLERYNQALQAFTLTQSAGLSKADKERAKQLLPDLPVPLPVPKLKVMDPETEEELPVRWPLYDPEWHFEEQAPIADPATQARIDELQSRLDAIEAHRTKQEIQQASEI